jgi:hypothetical protein
MLSESPPNSSAAPAATLKMNSCVLFRGRSSQQPIKHVAMNADVPYNDFPLKIRILPYRTPMKAAIPSAATKINTKWPESFNLMGDTSGSR